MRLPTHHYATTVAYRQPPDHYHRQRSARSASPRRRQAAARLWRTRREQARHREGGHRTRRSPLHSDHARGVASNMEAASAASTSALISMADVPHASPRWMALAPGRPRPSRVLAYDDALECSNSSVAEAFMSPTVLHILTHVFITLTQAANGAVAGFALRVCAQS